MCVCEVLLTSLSLARSLFLVDRWSTLRSFSLSLRYCLLYLCCCCSLPVVLVWLVIFFSRLSLFSCSYMSSFARHGAGAGVLCSVLLVCLSLTPPPTTKTKSDTVDVAPSPLSRFLFRRRVLLLFDCVWWFVNNKKGACARVPVSECRSSPTVDSLFSSVCMCVCVCVVCRVDHLTTLYLSDFLNIKCRRIPHKHFSRFSCGAETPHRFR